MTRRPRAEVDREIIAGAGPYFGGLDTSRLAPNKGGGIGLEFLSDKDDGIKDVDYAFKVHAATERTLNRIWREHRGIGRGREGEAMTDRPPITTIMRWGVLWRSVSRRAPDSWLIFDGAGVALFVTREAAREWINARYSYIRYRKDLRVEPHCWRMPQAVRVELTARIVRAAGKGKAR